MQYSQIPNKFTIAFASGAGGGYINPIPEASQIGIANGRASLFDGFPPLNFLPVGAGGVPPFGQDMNGILNQITLWTQWQNAGALTKYDAAFSSAVGGYPFGALLAGTTAGTVWLCTADNNTSNPDAAGPNWVNLGTQISTISVGTDSGSANVLTGTVAPVPTAYNDGAIFIIKKTGADNTGAMTGNIAALGSLPIVMPNGAALPAGAYRSAAFGILEYNLASTSLILLNPATTGLANYGVAVSPQQVASLDIANLNAPVAPLNTADLFAMQSIADGKPVQRTLAAILALTTAGSGRILRVTLLTGNGTWNRPSDTKNVIAITTGSGGAGGGDPSSQSLGSGTGGAAGGTAIGFADVSALASIAYNHAAGGTGVAGADGNAGGTSNFGTITSATGGAGGWNSQKVNTLSDLPSPAAGVGTVGLMLLKGQDGGWPAGGTAPLGNSPGMGGSSFWGAGGGGRRVDTGSTPGAAGGNYGGGGGGGDRDDSTGGSTGTGGAGGDGCTLLIELS